MIETFNSLWATGDHGLMAFLTLFGLAVTWLVLSLLVMIVIGGACLLAKKQYRDEAATPTAKPSPEIGRQIKGRIAALNPKLLK